MRVPHRVGAWIAFLVVALGAVTFGAYTAFDDGGPCHGFEVPPSKGGDSYHYAADGPFLLTSNKMIAGDWNVVDGADEQGRVVLEGGEVEVTVAKQPRDALSISGEHRPAFQVSYVASDPTRGSGLHVADEWLDAENGETVEARMPSVIEKEDGVLHHRHFTRTGWAGLMHAPDLWERSLSEGESWSVSFPEGFPNTQAEPSQASVTFTVERLWESEQGCQARVHATHPYANASLTLSEEVPVPTAYEAEIETARFEMTLEGWERGDGSSLALIERPEGPRSGLGPLEPLEDQFLADAEGIFATDWPTALAAIEDDEEAQAWLSNHPDAAVADVDYRQGPSDSRVENRWRVTWWPGPNGSASMENEVTTRSDPVSEALDREITVDTSYGEKAPRPVINESVTLPSLDELHRRTYGVPLETIGCMLFPPSSGSKCLLAPHDDVNKPRAGPGAGFWHSGLIVDLRDGRVLQETSFAERVIDPPAQGG